MALKLFLFEDLESVQDWAPGAAVALAETKAGAIDLIVDFYNRDEGDEQLRAELEASEPIVNEGPCGFTFTGSA